MDEQELDDWFSTQKEMLEEAFYKAVNEQRKESEPERKKFDSAYSKLLTRFQKKQAGLYKKQVRDEKKRERLRAREQWKAEKKEDLIAWKERWVERVKKWWFEIRFKRILKNEKRY